MKCVKKLSLLSLVTCILSSCGPEQADHVKAAYRIMHEHIDDMKNDYGARPYGIGGGFLENVNKLRIHFVVVGSFTVEEARRFLYQTSQQFLKKINDDEEIRPYLSDYPFTANNLSYSFFVRNEDSQKVIFESFEDYDGHVSDFGIYEGKISYSISTQDKLGYQDVHRETFAEAEEILRNEGFLLKVSNTPEDACENSH